MIDALLFAVRDTLRSAGLGYDEATSEITDAEGHPPARCGAIFCAVHQLDDGVVGGSLGRLDELYSFGLTLTMRVNVALDRVGDKLLAARLARQRGPTGQPSFNARCDALRALFHEDWLTLQQANNYLTQWVTDTVVYGFCEPARYRGGFRRARLVGPEWFGAEPPDEGVAPEVGLVATGRFEDCRRMQAIETYV